MDALLLAAGLGTRLRPLTLDVPKPLLPIYGQTLLDFHLSHLFKEKGPSPEKMVQRVVVNGHHLADELRAYLVLHRERGRLLFSHEPQILGTGGAIAQASRYLTSEPFLVLNADAFFRPPIEEAVAFHRQHGRVATMILTDCAHRPNVQVKHDRVSAILRGQHMEDALTFTGFHVLSREVQRLLPKGTFHDIRDTYDVLIQRGQLSAFVWKQEMPFLDIGTPRAYLEAHRISAGDSGHLFGLMPAAGIRLADGYGFIDQTAVLGKDCRVAESIILAGAHLAERTIIKGSIIGPGIEISGESRNRLVTTHGSTDIGD
jgi:NDP-sugar pyrophosphorylase family protein